MAVLEVVAQGFVLLKYGLELLALVSALSLTTF